MLQEIVVAGEASYADMGERLSNLKAINFIFGTNGSGKTTISRVIAAPASHPACNLTWLNARVIECLVYNSDFTTKNYASSMPGIFTLGQESAEALTKIEIAKAKVGDLLAHVEKLEATLGPADGSSGKRGELRALRAALEAKCWDIKGAHDKHFQDAFSGFRNSRERFCDKVLFELHNNQANLVELEDLKRRALTVFEKGLERQAPIAPVEMIDLIELEKSPALAKKIVGKEDVDLAALIRRLSNSDWVRQGIGYITNKGGQCPFCQQDVTDELFRKLNDYFDETYLKDIAAIDKVCDAYETYSSDVLEKLEAVLILESRYIDAAALRAAVDRLASRIDLNKRQLERKRKESSAPIALEGIREFTTAISKIIDAANGSIEEHNAMVENLAAEQATLKSEIWKCLLEESSGMLAEYSGGKINLDKAVTGLTQAIDAKRAELATVGSDLMELERGITSVQPTVNAINAILTSFGFNSFKLATAGEHGNLYEIIRGDGSNAATTLSEGERSFITFLYFYHLIRGSISESGTTADRVVVFDDPVSSLDSDVLFIVSALIKRVLEEACNATGYVKQVFILTHNIYFHKEVSFDPKRSGECRAHETFWIVRKVAGKSAIVGYTHNPIKTSYELLWAEVRSANRSNMTIQNTLRRILESYFKILGNLDKDDIVAKFEGRDQQICGSLFSWVNDGSHGVHDDLYVSADEQAVARYLDVFRYIFDKTGHSSHYSMMMGAGANAPSPTAELGVTVEAIPAAA